MNLETEKGLYQMDLLPHEKTGFYSSFEGYLFMDFKQEQEPMLHLRRSLLVV